MLQVITETPWKIVAKCDECFGDGSDCDDSSRPCFNCGGTGTIEIIKQDAPEENNERQAIG